ncbi:hypothetical protein [Prevotella dentasini]|uniref:hypothetical protein n=1 Tax=Prevotella dentasini TaxID=589537 RepID=UPI0005636BAB|nr:hypothetical protein [Prevotella dentasini]
MEQDHIDRALQFTESLEKLGNQLRQADAQQQLLLSRMLEMSRNSLTDTAEYRELGQRSRNLQAMIDKWRPVYEKRLALARSARRG